MQTSETPNSRFVTVYPNPVQANRLNATVYSNNNIKATISLLSASSQKEWQTQQTLQTGNNRLSIPVANLKNGIHFLIIEKGDERIIKKIVIQR